ncbi:MAG: hypothetical protein RSE32_03330 [Comamonas sp.]|uniref:hypothetical protein n=1 Tax=Comamonas sp. TaxID=34028 RepID=UPI002FC9A6BD
MPTDQQPRITAISVFVEFDGRLCLAPIAPESAQIFVSMLSAYQSNPDKGVTLYPVPDEARECVYQAGQIIGAQINKGRTT